MRQQWFLTLHEQPAIKVSHPICYVMKGPEVARKWMGKSWGMKWGISVYYLYGTVKINSSGPNIRLSATCNQSVVPGSLDMLKSTNQSSTTGDMVSQPFVLAGLLLDHGLHFRGQHLQSPDNFRDRQRERSVCVCVCVCCVWRRREWPISFVSSLFCLLGQHLSMVPYLLIWDEKASMDYFLIIFYWLCYYSCPNFPSLPASASSRRQRLLSPIYRQGNEVVQRCSNLVETSLCKWQMKSKA